MIDTIAAIPGTGGPSASPLLYAALPTWLLWLGGGVVGVGLLCGAAVLLYRTARGGAAAAHAPEEDWPLPPLIVPPGLSEGRVPRTVASTARAVAPLSPAQHANGSSAAPAGVPQPLPGGAEEAEPAGEQVEVGRVRFHRPPDGTLQLLPGRLEILSGDERVEEIRFVRIPGRDAVITFGRKAGEPHTHVQLRSPTVSRMHAVMRYHMGRWHIANLSHTNPVLVGGHHLPSNGNEAIPLEDGDQVEMGEVTFRFRQR